MSRLGLILLLLASSVPAWAKDEGPQIGYIYPAGGQAGRSFDVLVGGRNLTGASAVRVTGEGVRADVVEHVRPLNQGQFKELQNRMGELRRRKTETPEDWSAKDERDLAALRRRLDTFSIRRSSVPALVETVTLRVTIDPDAEPGDRQLRLRAEDGLTNPLVFRVGTLPEVAEASARSVAIEESRRRGRRGRKRQARSRPDPGTTPTASAPEVEVDVELPVLVNGQILPGDVDRYRFRARRGQRLVVRVAARALIPYLSDAVPGWFQATAALFDSQGTELAHADDASGFDPDPLLLCEVPADGMYVVEIRDALYRGREDFVYRMTLGELPYITSIFPLGGRVGGETTVALRGWNLPTSELTKTETQSGVRCIRVGRDMRWSNAVPFAVDALPECLEMEPNGGPEATHTLDLPVIVNGRIDGPGDLDVFGFRARRGTYVVAEVWARRLGSPLDSFLRMTDAIGTVLAKNDDSVDPGAGLVTHHADARVSIRVPAAGDYRLWLGDTQSRGGDALAYRLHVRERRPDFALRVVPSTVNARAGTTVPITVHALRRDGFSDAIDLALENPPPGLVLSGADLPEDVSVLRCTLTVPSMTRQEPYAVTLVGRAKIGRSEVARQAVPADDRMQAFIYRHLVPADEFLVTAVGEPRSFSARVLTRGRIRVPVGGTAKVRVDVPQRTRFGAVQFELSDPPKGVAIERVDHDRNGSVIILRSERGSVEPGIRGNLIIYAFASRTREDSGKGKEQRKRRRISLGALPAIPFAVARR